MLYGLFPNSTPKLCIEWLEKGGKGTNQSTLVLTYFPDCSLSFPLIPSQAYVNLLLAPPILLVVSVSVILFSAYDLVLQVYPYVSPYWFSAYVILPYVTPLALPDWSMVCTLPWGRSPIQVGAQPCSVPFVFLLPNSSSVPCPFPINPSLDARKDSLVLFALSWTGHQHCSLGYTPLLQVLHWDPEEGPLGTGLPRASRGVLQEWTKGRAVSETELNVPCKVLLQRFSLEI